MKTDFADAILVAAAQLFKERLAAELRQKLLDTAMLDIEQVVQQVCDQVHCAMVVQKDLAAFNEVQLVQRVSIEVKDANDA